MVKKKKNECCPNFATDIIAWVPLYIHKIKFSGMIGKITILKICTIKWPLPDFTKSI